jgi:hypothetical protein
MEAALDRNTYDEWLHAVQSSRAGGLSSFGINIRDPELTERSYQSKARMDIADFNDAGFWHDLSIIRKAAAVAVKRLTYVPPAATAVIGGQTSPDMMPDVPETLPVTNVG